MPTNWNEPSPQDWQAPRWHSDFGDPRARLAPLKRFASRLLSTEPKARMALKTPEVISGHRTPVAI